MAMANQHSTTPLSNLIRDPMVRDAFRRAERDSGAAYAVPAPKPPKLTDGAAAKPRRELASV
jgi:hypothetical protein